MVSHACSDATKPIDYSNRPGFRLEGEGAGPDEQPGFTGVGSIMRGSFSPQASFAVDDLSSKVLSSSVRSQRCVMLRENH